MTPDLWPQIIIASSTLLAAFGGFVFAGRNEARRDDRAAEREKLARDEERRAAAIRDRHQFQLETLLALQDALQLMARHTGRVMHLDHMNAREEEYTQLPEDLSDDILANGFDVIRLRNRILDQELREAIGNFEAECATSSLPPIHYKGLSGDALETAALTRSTRFNGQYTIAMNHLGTALRAELDWTPTHNE